MTIRRGRLYAGVFVLALGGVTLAGAAEFLDRTAVASALGILAPATLLAFGAALVLRRTRASLPAGLAAAVVPGLLLGGALVAVPTMTVPCGAAGQSTAAVATRSGTFGAAATVDLHVACGELRATTQPGSDWRLDARDGLGRPTVLSADAGSLSLDAGHGARGWVSNRGRTDWSLALPTAPVLDVTTRVDTGKASLDLGDAAVRSLELTVDAADARVDLSGSPLDQATVTVNAGAARVALPDRAFRLQATADAGSIRLCVPPGLALRVRSQATLASVRYDGLVRQGDLWVASTSPSTLPGAPGSATAIADLSLDASVGSITITTLGGCQ